ncbi:hypothetical protein DKX38_014709 [Salix brachista]|uniref:Agenet domain-containing protein n=1 Tax=Salix brachista TaxID=2182728 RepID=A0A5N5LG04_9ROSI|nr:hypothetical protein DKX38_014709 [Salix brachista]
MKRIKSFKILILVNVQELLVEEEDMSKLLIETVSDDEVRPGPPRIKFGRGFSVFDKVDVSDNDGWRAGKVTGQRGPLYFVHFEKTGDEIAYHVSRSLGLG